MHLPWGWLSRRLLAHGSFMSSFHAWLETNPLSLVHALKPGQRPRPLLIAWVGRRRAPRRTTAVAVAAA